MLSVWLLGSSFRVEVRKAEAACRRWGPVLLWAGGASGRRIPDAVCCLAQARTQILWMREFLSASRAVGRGHRGSWPAAGVAATSNNVQWASRGWRQARPPPVEPTALVQQLARQLAANSAAARLHHMSTRRAPHRGAMKESHKGARKGAANGVFTWKTNRKHGQTRHQQGQCWERAVGVCAAGRAQRKGGGRGHGVRLSDSCTWHRMVLAERKSRGTSKGMQKAECEKEYMSVSIRSLFITRDACAQAWYNGHHSSGLASTSCQT